MPTSPTTQIRSLTESFVHDLAALVRASALEAVHDVLGGRGPGRPRKGKVGRPKGSRNKTRRKGRGPGRPKGKATKRGPGRPKKAKRAKRSTAQVEVVAKRVLAYVKKNAGQGVEGIAKGLKTTSKNLKLPITRLLESKLLRTTGQRRGTRYHAGGSRARTAKSKPRGRATKARKAASRRAPARTIKPAARKASGRPRGKAARRVQVRRAARAPSSQAQVLADSVK